MIQNKPVAELGVVRAAREISSHLWDLEIEAPNIARATQAGQFVHVRATGDYNPFLRRPLSVGPIVGDRLRLIFHIRGEGTRLLAAKHAGEVVDMIGPLGSPFIIPDENEPLIFVTGGIGVVPLLLLDDQLPPGRRREFILGVRSIWTIPITEEEAKARHIRWASDDGSLGYHGNSIALLQQLLDQLDSSRNPLLLGCGPGLMLKGMKKLCEQGGHRAMASLEVPMGCGVGACQSCAVPRADGNGYFLVCKDGPVFDCADVMLEPRLLP